MIQGRPPGLDGHLGGKLSIQALGGRLPGASSVCSSVMRGRETGDEAREGQEGGQWSVVGMLGEMRTHCKGLST